MPVLLDHLGLPPSIIKPLVGRWCARPCDGQLTPAKRMSVCEVRCLPTARLLPAPTLRTSARPASRAATQNLADFTGTLYPQLRVPHRRGPRRVKMLST